MAGSDGLLAEGLVRALAGPQTSFALYSEYRRGLDNLIELACSLGSKAVSVCEAQAEEDMPPLFLASRSAAEQFGRIDVALHADLPDLSVFPSDLSSLSLQWWTHVWAEFTLMAPLGN